MDRQRSTGLEGILEQLIEHGVDDMANVFAGRSNWPCGSSARAHPCTGHYERTAGRRGYANGTKPKRIDTPAGTVTVQVPKSAGHENEPFYPQSLERGRRSVRAVMRGRWPRCTSRVFPPARPRR